MDERSPEEAAKELKVLFFKAFGERKSGVYRISREGLRTLTGRVRLEEIIIKRVASALCKSHALVLVQGEDCFGVMRAQQMQRWREVPQAVLRKHAPRPAAGLNPTAAWPFPPESES